MNILVLGIGNVLLSDEGIGVRAIDELQKHYRFSEDVELLDGGTSGIELLPYIQHRDYLVIIDAIKSGHAPGTILRVEGDDVPARFRTRISPHQIGLSDLLATAEISGNMPKNLVLFGIEPKSMELNLELSQEVQDGLDRLLEVVIEELRGLGCSVEKADQTGEQKAGFWNARMVQ